LISYEDARIESPGDQYFSYLVVSGLSAYANIRVELMPLVYITQPDYWEVELVGSVVNFALPAVTPFEVRLPLERSYGSEGIRVVGAYGQATELTFDFEPRTNPDDAVRVALMQPLDPKRTADHWNRE
jgi:hypothetical protein